VRVVAAIGAALAAVAVAVALVVALGDDERPASAGASDPTDLSVSPVGWTTDFSRHSVPLDEFTAGGPPRDGIPPIDAPRFTPATDAEGTASEPVIEVEIDGEARAYPIRILIWHEIVNDTLAGTPIAVTFCPLCNTSVVFDRRVDGRELTFGTTGNLRRSDLVMWDRQTESWWQQFSGDAIVGELTGTRLERVASRIVSLGDFRTRHPGAEVLSQDTGHDRPYGRNPYAGYDDVDSPPFLLDGTPDGRLAPKERVVSIEDGEALIAVPFTALADRPVIDAAVGGRQVTVWWRPGVSSALDRSNLSDGRDVGGVAVYDRRLGGRTLTFTSTAGGVRDDQTGSAWGLDGVATGGPLAGRRLTPVLHDTPFWFAVGAFRPDARIVPAP
jgi:hypothetical protein